MVLLNTEILPNPRIFPITDVIIGAPLLCFSHFNFTLCKICVPWVVVDAVVWVEGTGSSQRYQNALLEIDS